MHKRERKMYMLPKSGIKMAVNSSGKELEVSSACRTIMVKLPPTLLNTSVLSPSSFYDPGRGGRWTNGGQRVDGPEILSETTIIRQLTSSLDHLCSGSLLFDISFCDFFPLCAMCYYYI